MLFQMTLLFVLLGFPILQGEPSYIELEQLLHGNYNEKEVQTRGFLYELNEQESILALQPNLKSCCVGNKENRNKQILILGRWKGISDSVVEVSGVFKVNDRHAAYPFVLDRAEIKEKNKGKTGWLGLAVIVVGVIGFILKRLERT